MKKTELIIKELIKKQEKKPVNLESFKRKMAKKYQIPCPSNVELLKAYYKLTKKQGGKEIKEIKKLLQTRPVRSLSGIVNVSVLTKPYPCPGECIYCPYEEGVPKSYLSGEPAVERAKGLNYSPYPQTKNRIQMLKAQGHPQDKIDLRIIGGTWSFYPLKYQEWFIKRCFDACNQKNSKNLRGAHLINEKSKRRIVGLSIETRPDFINKGELKRLRRFGVTKVELGIQSVYNSVLKLNKRGHNVQDIVKATKTLKDAGFKVSYQMMINLPGSSPQKDVQAFKNIFTKPEFEPDSLKIYPCALVKEAPLYRWFLKGKYKPYSKKTLVSIIKKIKKMVPYYIRIERIIRDIPAPYIIKGPAKISNLREVVQKKIKKEGWSCKCIRCREIRKNYKPEEKLSLFRQEYKSSGGKDVFLSFEDNKRKKIYSLLRLRKTSLEATRNPCFPVLKNAGIIREIHTYGQLVPIAKDGLSAQHKGLGSKLIKEAERITKEEFGFTKTAVIAAVGTRQYYRKFGYRLKGTYMVRVLGR